MATIKQEISTALQLGDFDTALPFIESMTGSQLLELTLPYQCTPLHYACQHGRIDVAERLINNFKCSIESKDAQGRTPLHTAAQHDQVEILKLLLQSLQEVSGFTWKKLSYSVALMLLNSCRDQSGNTPLHTACIHGQLDTVQFLAREIRCDKCTNSDGLSSLHLAAQHGHLPVVGYLLEELRVDMDALPGISPAYLAVGKGHLDLLKYLVARREKSRCGKN